MVAKCRLSATPLFGCHCTLSVPPVSETSRYGMSWTYRHRSDQKQSRELEGRQGFRRSHCVAISPCFVSRIFTGQIESRVRVARQIARYHTLPRWTALPPDIDWPGPYDVAVARLISSRIAISRVLQPCSYSSSALFRSLSLHDIKKQQGKTDICAFSLPPRLTPALRQ